MRACALNIEFLKSFRYQISHFVEPRCGPPGLLAATAAASKPRSPPAVGEVIGERGSESTERRPTEAPASSPASSRIRWFCCERTEPRIELMIDRRELAAPVAGALFFAGEATHIGVNPCMQAALETGERAAREVAQSLVAQRPSRL